MFSVQSSLAKLEPAGVFERLLSGEGATFAHELATVEGVKAGVWEVTPGVFESDWDTWEIFTVTSGSGTLTDGNGNVHELVPGALVVVPPGSSATWDIKERLTKTFVTSA